MWRSLRGVPSAVPRGCSGFVDFLDDPAAEVPLDEFDSGGARIAGGGPGVVRPFLLGRGPADGVAGAGCSRCNRTAAALWRPARGMDRGFRRTGGDRPATFGVLRAQRRVTCRSRGRGGPGAGGGPVTGVIRRMLAPGPARVLRRVSAAGAVLVFRGAGSAWPAPLRRRATLGPPAWPGRLRRATGGPPAWPARLRRRATVGPPAWLGCLRGRATLGPPAWPAPQRGRATG